MKKFNASYIGIRKDLLKFIEGGNNIVLDVGCANGNNGKYLLENKYATEVYGIEYDTEMAIEAQKKNTQVFLGDLNNFGFLKHVSEECPQMDYILCGDVLEHLIEPLHTLSVLAQMLKTDGSIIISVPNIAHIELFIQVYLNGTWPQNERCIFDKKHLRWFTKNELYELVALSGLKVDEYHRKFRARDAKGSKFTWKYKLLKLINKDMVTFQHIVKCSHGK